MPRSPKPAASRSIGLLLTGLLLAGHAASPALAQTGGQPADDRTPVVDALSPVVVTADRERGPGSAGPGSGVATVDRVDGSELRDGQLQINLSEGLARVPGLVIRNRENYAQDLQISIRGSGSRATFGVRGLRLFVDGIPASAPDGQGQAANFPLGSADHIDVVRGPFATLYGASSGGVILLTTADGTRPAQWRVGAAAGPDGLWRLGTQASGTIGADDGWSWGLDVSRFATDGVRPQSAADRTTANLKLARRDAGGRTVLVVNDHDSRALDPLGLTRAEFDADPGRTTEVARSFDTRKTVSQRQVGIAREQSLGGGHAIEAMAYVGERRVVQFQAIPIGAQSPPGSAGGVIDLDRNYWGLNLRWRLDRTLDAGPAAGDPVAGDPAAGDPAPRLRLAAGLAVDRQTDDRRGFENFVGTTTGVRGRLRRDEVNRAQSLDPYLQAEWQTGPWTVAAGLRYTTVELASRDRYVTAGNGDDSGRARYEGALPVIGLRHRLSPSLQAFASIGRGLETPTLNEIAYTAGLAGASSSGFNTSLNAARSTSSEAGLRGRFGQGSWTATAFDIRTRDEIVVLTNSGGRSTFQNAGRTRRHGLELAADHRWRDLTASAALTWIDARYRDGFLTCTASPCTIPSQPIPAGNRLPGIPREQLFVRLDWRPSFGPAGSPLATALAGTLLGVELRHVGRVMVDDRNSDAAGRATLLALSARFRQAAGPWTFSEFVRLDNLTDRRYAGSVIVNEGNARYFEPGAGRSLMAGLEVSRRF